MSQGFQVLFAEDVGVLGESTVLLRFGGKLHELLGQRCHCGVFAVGIAFSQQFAEVGEGFAGIFLVNFGEECGYAAVVNAIFASFIDAQTYGIKIRTQAGLEEQTVVEAVGEAFIGIVDGINDVLRFFLAEVVEVWGAGAGKGIENGNPAVQLGLFLSSGIGLAKHFPKTHDHDLVHMLDLGRGEADAFAFLALYHGFHGALEVFEPLRIGIRPSFEQFVAQGELFFFGCRVFVLLQHICQFGRLGGGFAQVAQSAAAAQVHFLLLFVGKRDAVAVAAVQTVSREAQIAHDMFVAVFIGVTADFGESVAVAEVFIRLCIAKIERLDAQVFERKDFAFFADAVVIEVAPNAEFAEGAVGGIQLAVAVVVQISGSFKAVRGSLAIFEQGVVAEDFAAVVNFAVAVAVIHQDTVVTVYPAGGSADTETLVVEHRAVMTVGGEGFDAVAVQIEGEGVVLVVESAAEQFVPSRRRDIQP